MKELNIINKEIHGKTMTLSFGKNDKEKDCPIQVEIPCV